MKNTITFIGKFDENLLQLEEEVLNIGNQSKTPEKLIDKIDGNLDINSISPTVDKHEIKEYNCDLWVTLGNVKPTVLLKSLIFRSNIVILVFNLEKPDTLKFLNEGWLPIFKQINPKHENQEVLLFGTGKKSTEDEAFIDEIQQTMKKENFNCKKYFECEQTSKNKYETKCATIDISKNLIQYLKDLLEPTEINKNDNDNDNDNDNINHNEDEVKIEEEEEVSDEEDHENKEKIKRQKEIKNDNDINDQSSDKKIENKEAVIFTDSYNVSYRLSDENFTAEIIQSPEVKGDLFIPTFIEFKSNKYSIIQICDFSFQNSQINKLSFSDDSKVKKFGSSIFKNSTIKQLSIPQNLHEINEHWIDDANELETIIVDEKNQYIKNDDGFIIIIKDGENDKKTRKILFSPRSVEGKYIVPGDTTCIGRCAFNKRQRLQSFISDKSSLKMIKSYSFYQCENLEKFIFTSNSELTLGGFCFSRSSKLSIIEITCESIKIGKECFSNCSSLSSFILKVTKNAFLCSELFKGCSNLENIAFMNANTIKIGDECFSNSPSLKSIALVAESINFGKNIFNNCKLLSCVVIQSQNDINISNDTFKSCDLKTIKFITSGKLKLEENCFEKSINLDTVDFSFNSMDFKNNCFLNCSLLKFVSFRSESDIFINNVIFCECQSLQKLVLESKSKIVLSDNSMNELSKLESIEIIGRNIIIGNNCFMNCPSFLNFSIKRSGNIEMHENEFINCDKLESIYIESKIENEIGESCQINFYPKCFNKLKSLKNIFIIGGEIKINESSFIDCSSLRFISITQASNVCIEQNLFLNNKSLKIFSIESNSSIFLRPNCLNACINLVTINLNGKKIFIGDNCFANCTGINEIVISEVQELSIGEKAFLNCSNLQKVDFKAKSEITIKNNCFGNTKVETATFQGNTVCIGSKCFEVSAFWKSPQIKTVDITCAKLIISDECFQNCSSLTMFSVKNAKEIKLGKNAFENCKNIENITLNAETYLWINENCFLKAKKLKTLEFDSKEVIIGLFSFSECNSLNSIKSQKSDKVFLGQRSFLYCSSLNEIDITANSEFQVGDYCFHNLRNLQTVKINSQKINIGDFSFYNCLSIKTISFPTVTYYSSYDSSFYPIADKVNIKKGAFKRLKQSEKFYEQMKNEQHKLNDF